MNISRFLLEKRAKQIVKNSGKTSPEKKEEELQSHQEGALTKLEKEDGVLIHHSTGSGKTKTFLEAVRRVQAKNPNSRTLIVAPASLVSNVHKEIEKHKIPVDLSKVDLHSYEKAVNIADELKKNKYDLAIADEAQKLRNASTKRTQTLSEIMTGADKRLLATATANYNQASDIAPLLNIVAGRKVLPNNPTEFNKHFTKTEPVPRTLTQVVLRQNPGEKVSLRNNKYLEKVFEKHVHYYDSKDDPGSKKMFPEKTEENVDVEMSPAQARMYKFVEGDLPLVLRWKIRNNLPLDKQEKASLNSFSTGVRQVSNSHRHLSSEPDSVEHTPKIKEAFSRMKSKMDSDKNYRGVVYSNFLDAGVKEYAKKLESEGIPHAVYTGQLSSKEKEQMVKDYNEGKNKLLLITSSGSEGLDLKGTKHIQVLEPHFNPSKIRQVVGRGARYGSHLHLPEKERNIHVEHFRSVHPQSFLGKTPYSIDKYLSENSDDKSVLFDQIKKIMKDTTEKTS